MKIAVCFFGYIGKFKRYHSHKFNNHKYIDISIPQRHFKEFFLKPNTHNQVDIFIHTSSTSFKDSLLKFYKPKNYLIEENPFKEPPVTKIGNEETRRLYALQSRLYSNKCVLDLMNNSGEKYDFVLMLRHDIVFFQPIIIDSLDNNYFYVVDAKDHPRYPNKDFVVPDWLYGGGQEIMTQFGEGINNFSEIQKFNKNMGEFGSYQHGACLYQILQITPDYSKVRYFLDMYNDHIICKYINTEVHNHPKRFTFNSKINLYEILPGKLKVSNKLYPKL